MKIEIQTWINNDVLRTISEEIKANEIKIFVNIWDEMIKFIKNPKNNWVGLAAPQIWINKRMICVSLLKTYDDSSFKTILMINPEIIEKSENEELDKEWCLSVPKKFWDVYRSTSIKVKYLDNKWKNAILSLEWISARIVQHEIDHLDGVLFTDKIVKKEDKIPNNHTF